MISLTGRGGVTLQCLLLSWATLINSGMCVDESLDVRRGEEVLLDCRFSPTLIKRQSTLYWIRSNTRNHDNVAIGQTAFHQDYRVDYSPSSGKYDLYVSNAEYNRDNGRFECRVKEDGTGVELFNKTISLTVLMRPEPPKLILPEVPAVEGRQYSLNCSSKGGSPPPHLVWVRTSDREIMDGNLTLGTHITEETSNVLTLTPSREEDGAEYTCQARNRAMESGEIMEITTNISVNFFPVVSVGPENPYRVELEHTAEIMCSVEAKPRAESVRWEFMGRFIDTNFKHVIPQVSLQDGGSYYCSADNGLGHVDKKELVLDVQYGPQVSITGPTEVSIGETISLHCQVSGNPRPLSTVWKKKSDPEFQFEGPILRIPNASDKDGDEYTCSSYNYIHPSLGDKVRREGSSSMVVEVRHPPGQAEILPEDAIAVAGRSVTLVCQANPPGYPAPSFRWWKEGRDSSVLSVSSHYTIPSVEVNSVGRYYCQPHNSLGQGQVASVDLQVYQTPKLTSTPPETMVKKSGDSNLQISCSATAHPRPTVRWFKDGVEISHGSSSKFQVSVTEQGQNVLSALSFVGPKRELGNRLNYLDRGHYSCQFENQVGRTETTTEVKIEHKPIPQHKFDKVGFSVGDEARLECLTRAFPKPRFDWTIGDDTIESGVINYHSNVSQLAEDLYLSVLTISRVRSSSYGLYTCRALNSMGAMRTSIRMDHKGVPSTPSNLTTMDIGSDYVVMAWDPGYHGGYPHRTSHVIQFTRTEDGKEDTFTCEIDDKMTGKGHKLTASSDLAGNVIGWMRKCNLTGLSQFTEYSIRVRASNPAGDSEWSDTVRVLTRLDPSRLPAPARLTYETSTGLAHLQLPAFHLQLEAVIEALDDVGGRRAWPPGSASREEAGGRTSDPTNNEWRVVTKQKLKKGDTYLRVPLDVEPLNLEVKLLEKLEASTASKKDRNRSESQQYFETNKVAMNTNSPALPLVVDDVDSGMDDAANNNIVTAAPLRVRLCLAANSSLCGSYTVGTMVEVMSVPLTDTSSADGDGSSVGQPWLIALIVVVTLLGLVALLVAVKCVCQPASNGGKGRMRSGGVNSGGMGNSVISGPSFGRSDFADGMMTGSVGVGAVKGFGGLTRQQKKRKRRPGKILLHSGPGGGMAADTFGIDSYSGNGTLGKGSIFAIAGDNQHGTAGSYNGDPSSHQIEGSSSNSQSDSANSTEPLWAYQKSPTSTTGALDLLHYPATALAGYDNSYNAYPYIDETPSSERNYFVHPAAATAQQHPSALGVDAGGQRNSFYLHQSGAAHLAEDAAETESGEATGGAVMSGEYSCSGMGDSGYSYQGGLPDPSSYFGGSEPLGAGATAGPQQPPTVNSHSGDSHAATPRSPTMVDAAQQTPNTRARRIVHEVIV